MNWQLSFHKVLAPLSSNQRRTLIIAIPMTCLFASLAAFAWLKSTMIIDDIDVQEAQRVQIETKQLLTALLNAEDYMQGYGLTKRSFFLTAYHASLLEISDSLTDLELLVQDNLQQHQNLNRIRKLVGQSIGIMQQKINF